MQATATEAEKERLYMCRVQGTVLDILSFVANKLRGSVRLVCNERVCDWCRDD